MKNIHAWPGKDPVHSSIFDSLNSASKKPESDHQDPTQTLPTLVEDDIEKA